MSTKIIEVDTNLVELVKSIRNRCLIFLILLERPEAPGLVATLLEDIYQDAQEIIDDYCVANNAVPD